MKREFGGERIPVYVCLTHLEPAILECEVKWALESITISRVIITMSLTLDVRQQKRHRCIEQTFGL